MTTEASIKPATIAPIKLQPVQDSGEFSQLLDSDRFAQIQRVAKLYSESDFVTDAYRGKVANCAIAIQSAIRLRVDPQMFMQHSYLVHGRPGMEAQLVIALVNARGPFTGPLQWKSEGEGDKRSWTCYATHKQTGELCQRTVTWSLVKAEGWLDKAGSKWKTMPDQMGCYRSASWLARLYCPEVLLGFPTTDELEDIGERVVPGERIDPLPVGASAVERIKAAVKRSQVDVLTGEIQSRPAVVETEAEGQEQPAPATAGDGPGVTYAEVMEQVNKALTGADFDLCHDLARELKDPQQRVEVETAIQARLKDLAAQVRNRPSRNQGE